MTPVRVFFALSAMALAWLQVSPAAAQGAAAPAAPKVQPSAMPPAPAATDASEPNDAAVSAATAAMIAAASAESDHWLDLIDRGKFDESWMTAAVVLQETITQTEWNADLAARRRKLGRTIMRERKSGTYSKTLRGAPTGHYVTVTYLTKFEKTALVEETLAVARDAIGQWHVAGYDIQLSSVKTP